MQRGPGPGPGVRGGVPTNLRLLLVIGLLAGLAAAYASPVREYLDARSELREHQLRLTAAQGERDHIAARLRALREPAVLEARARELGMVRPGEKPFIVRGLAPPPPPPEPRDDAGGVVGWLRTLL